MTAIIVPPKSIREQEKFRQRQDSFYALTVEQNNDRLNGKPQNFDSLMQEIKFIEAELLSRFGDEV